MEYNNNRKVSNRYEKLIYEQRPVYHHHRMQTSHRAKQFAPFAALKGFETSIGKKDGIFWQMELNDHPLEELESVYEDFC